MRDLLSSELLGHAADVPVLLVTCDDLGMHPSINRAVVRALDEGVAGSCSLMVPCPAAPDAVRLLRARPGTPFGIHLTLTRDTPGHRWGPVSPATQVPSLLDDDGQLFTSAGIPRLLAQASTEDVERELRAQIGVVVRSGLAPTHLDWHCMADGGRPDLLDLTVELALEFGLAARIWLDPGRAAARRRGLPVVDHPFLDSFSLDVAGRSGRYVELLRALPAGLTEWAVHPGLDDDASRDVDAGWAVRRADLDFLTSPVARQVMAEEGIVVIDHSGLQALWRTAGHAP